MLTMEQIEEIAKLNGIEIIENPTQEELEEHSESLLLSLADIVDYRRSLVKIVLGKIIVNILYVKILFIIAVTKMRIKLHLNKSVDKTNI